MQNLRTTFRTLAPLSAALVLVLAACTPAAAPAPTAAPSKPAPTAAPAKPAAAPTDAPAAAKPAAKAGAADMDALYEAAKQEGKVVWYSTMNLTDAPKILPLFRAKYPGVEIEHVRTDGEELIQRVITEVQAGRTVGDVLETNGQLVYTALLAGALDEYIAPAADHYPDNFKDPGNRWVVGRLRTDVIGINTSLLPMAEAPKNWNELTDPKWQGKILIEATNTTDFQALKASKFNGDAQANIEFWQKIAAQNPDLGRGSTEVVQQLAAGQQPILLGASGADIIELRDNGAPIDWVTSEIVVDPVITSMIKGAPHPNAAKLWLNWYLGPEGQKAIADMGRIPASPDVEAPGDQLPANAIKHVMVPELANDYAEDLAKWNEIFGLR